MTAPLYLDYAATAPLDPAVARAMTQCLTGAESFGNPSSTHALGRAAAALIEEARAQVAALVGAAPEEIVFTSGATESNNLTVLGVARANADRGRHIVTSRIEHKSVLDVAKRLEKEGFRVTWLAPDGAGSIDPAAVRAALRPDTILVSVMHVSNEIGVIQDVQAMGEACREAGIAFHTDAAQSAGRIALDVAQLPVDFMSLASHKICGPKGVGALYVRRGARPLIAPQTYGGGQERGLRPGTLPTHQIVGFGVAAQLAARGIATESERIAALHERLWGRLSSLPGVHLNGAAAPRVPHILNVSFEDVDGESLVAALGSLAVSTGSACSSAVGDPSYVLRALGRSTRLAESSLRLSLGRFTTAEEVDQAADRIIEQVGRLRGVAPRRARGAAAAPGKPLDSGPAGLMDEASDAARAARGAPGACGEPAALVGGPAALGALVALRAPDDSTGELGAEASRLFRQLPLAGVIPDGAPGSVLRGEAGGPEEEVWVRFHVLVDRDSVKDARFEARGCPHTLAAAAWVASQLPGRSRAQGIPGGPEAWARTLGVPVEKLGRLLVIEDALNAALGLEHSEADRS